MFGSKAKISIPLSPVKKKGAPFSPKKSPLQRQMTAGEGTPGALSMSEAAKKLRKPRKFNLHRRRWEVTQRDVYLSENGLKLVISKKCKSTETIQLKEIKDIQTGFSDETLERNCWDVHPFRVVSLHRVIDFSAESAAERDE